MIAYCIIHFHTVPKYATDCFSSEMACVFSWRNFQNKNRLHHIILCTKSSLTGSFKRSGYVIITLTQPRLTSNQNVNSTYVSNSSLEAWKLYPPITKLMRSHKYQEPRHYGGSSDLKFSTRYIAPLWRRNAM